MADDVPSLRQQARRRERDDQAPGVGGEGALPIPPVPGVREPLRECPAGADECRCRVARWSLDDPEGWLKRDAFDLGYLCSGGGGLAAYYRRHGLLSRRREDDLIPKRELSFGELDINPDALIGATDVEL